MSLKRKAFCGFLRALTEASKDRFSQEVKDRVLPVLETVGTTVNALAPGKSAAAVGVSTFVQGVITIDDDPVLPWPWFWNEAKLFMQICKNHFVLFIFNLQNLKTIAPDLS